MALKAILYLCGLAGAEGWWWLEWMQAQPAGTPRSAYWKSPSMYSNLSSVLVSLLLMCAYLAGGVTLVIRALVPGDWSAKIPELYLEWWFAPIAGLGITLGVRPLMKKLKKKVDPTTETKEGP